ncbi:MAG: GNAT family N-acetyltransferase [Planctomycetaceae bacterium]|jgi:ribosomal protein S18 acetylase RimI-like enzyme
MAKDTYKRLRMVADLRMQNLPAAALPEGYHWQSWRPMLTERHAQVKWHSFRNDLDGRVFGCLSRPEGCLSLVREIAAQRTFCANATWLVVYQPEPNWPPVDVGTIQGILRSGGCGAVQNVGVVPEHRGAGLGRALMLKAMAGFRLAGMSATSLEVTARNIPAVKLYESLGFTVRQTLYRVAETGEALSKSDMDQLEHRDDPFWP